MAGLLDPEVYSPATLLAAGGRDDAMLLLYAVGWMAGEAQDLLQTASRNTYFRDVFNLLDLSLIIGMTLTVCTRLLTPDVAPLTLPCCSHHDQTSTAAGCWQQADGGGLFAVFAVFAGCWLPPCCCAARWRPRAAGGGKQPTAAL